MKKTKYKFKKQKVVFVERKPFLADKEIIVRSGGRARVFNISHRLQVFLMAFLAATFIWSGVNYHFYHRKSKELGKARSAYLDLMSDVTVLQNNLKDVVGALEDADKGLEEINEYKEQAANVEDKIKKIADSEEWLNEKKLRDKISKRDALLQKEVVRRENAFLRQKIGVLGLKLENLQQTVKGLETAEIAILDKIEKISVRGIDDVKKSLSKINQTLRAQRQYFNPLANIQNGQGGGYVPAKGTIISEELQNKMSSVFQRIEVLEKYREVMGTVPLGSPVYKYHISSLFGSRSDPFRKRLARHSGLDMGALLGSRVSAPAAGKVVKAGNFKNGYGNMVEIKHANGFVTRYAHLHKIYVSEGDEVEYNDAIGEVGSTGRSTGSHLHYEVLYNGRNVNPLTFVNIGSMNKS